MFFNQVTSLVCNVPPICAGAVWIVRKRLNQISDALVVGEDCILSHENDDWIFDLLYHLIPRSTVVKLLTGDDFDLDGKGFGDLDSLIFGLGIKNENCLWCWLLA